jgi:H+-translocating NAD(P) transhydrogenase
LPFCCCCFVFSGKGRQLFFLFRALPKNTNLPPLTCPLLPLSSPQTKNNHKQKPTTNKNSAIIEAAHHFGRFFAGQITAAGRVPPAKVLVIGGGVAGLAAVGAAKSLGAVVRVFDTREAVREQAKSQGAEFLTVAIEEAGEGQGGYAKEMSQAFLDAELALFAQQLRGDIDIVVTTALIPNKPAPKLLTKEMIDSMRPGSVVVDLASEAGGNCEYTVPGEAVVTGGGVTVIGYTDLPSRLPQTASSLYSNNISKFLLSMGPFSTGEKGRFAIDHDDEAVRGALVLEKGELMWPAPPPKSVLQAQAAAAAAAAAATDAASSSSSSSSSSAGLDKSEKAAAPPSPEEALRAATLKSALTTTGAACATLALGAVSPTPIFSSMLTKFGLASISGYQTVWGVSPALHSPLMSVTNAISGLTAVGGMVLAGGGLVPQTPAQWLAATAVLCSAVNIGGGFTVTQRMLDMFRRPTDPPEPTELFAIPGAALLGGFFAGKVLGLDEVTSATYLVSAACCIAAIACLSKQSSARTGNALGMLGVAGGIVATLGTLLADSAAAGAGAGGGGPDYATAAQLVACLGAGGLAGSALARRIAITELPQTVAAFHALVGLAATLTAVATVSSLTHEVGAGGGGVASVDGLHATTAFLSDWIGAVTLTGSAVAFGKLQGILPSRPLAMPGKNAINLSLAALSVALAVAFVGGGAADAGVSAEAVMGATALVAGLLGVHLVASVGGADVPVIITLLNSYSGYALCAEGE